MPGLADVGLPEEGSTTLAADAGYGYTQALPGDDGPHHRFHGQLAFALHPLHWLGVGASVNGRYDKHPDDNLGKDDSYSGLPTLRLRAFDASSPLAYGAELAVEFPGSEAPSVEFAATTLNAKGLVAYRPDGSPLVVAANLGVRFDKSDAAAPELSTLRQGDRVALGASEFNSVLASVGAGYQVGNGLLMGELSLQAFTRSGMFSESPQRVALGYRHQLSEGLEVEGFVRINANSQPSVTPDAPLLPVEPRAGGWLGVRIAFGSPPAAEEPDTLPETDPTDDEKKVETPEPNPQPVEKATAAPVSGVVLDAEGAPLAQVEVELEVGEYSKTVTTDGQGKYVFDQVPFGKGQLRAKTVDYDPVTLDVDVSGKGERVELPQVRMKLQALAAQLQGLVQTFDGKPVAATITITPPGKQHRAGADGRFSIDVEPGTYTVKISAPGFAPQSHVVTVGEKAVVVVNADLRKAR